MAELAMNWPLIFTFSQTYFQIPEKYFRFSIFFPRTPEKKMEILVIFDPIAFCVPFVCLKSKEKAIDCLFLTF